MRRLLTRAIPALVVAAWLAPSFATIVVGFHLWTDHHGEFHSHHEGELETEVGEEDSHQHRLLIDADEEAVRLTRGQTASGPADALAPLFPALPDRSPAARALRIFRTALHDTAPPHLASSPTAHFCGGYVVRSVRGRQADPSG